jgi:type IV secretory pathway TrbD component
MATLRGTHVTFYSSLNRRFHIMGVNQRLFYLFLPLWGSVPIAWGFNPVMIGVAGMLFLVLHTIGVLLTRADEQILEIYNRHRRYKPRYTTISGIHAKVPKVQISVPYYQGRRGLV